MKPFLGLAGFNLIVSLFFSHLGFWSGNLFLIAPFPDLCLFVPFYRRFIQNFASHVKHFCKGLPRETAQNFRQISLIR